MSTKKTFKRIRFGKKQQENSSETLYSETLCNQSLLMRRAIIEFLDILSKKIRACDSFMFVRAQEINKEIFVLKNKISRKYGLRKLISNVDFIRYLTPEEIREYYDELQLLSRKPTRTLSGVAPVAIMTLPRECPYRCIYCPGGKNSVFGSVPQSYTGNEPASMRAKNAMYDSYLQVMIRLHQYALLNKSFSKVDLIIMGGTFLYYPICYQSEFITYAYKALNDFGILFGSSSPELFQDEFKILLFKQIFDLNDDRLIHGHFKANSDDKKAIFDFIKEHFNIELDPLYLKLVFLKYIDFDYFFSRKKERKKLQLIIRNFYRLFLSFVNTEKLKKHQIDNKNKLFSTIKNINTLVLGFINSLSIKASFTCLAKEKARNEHGQIRAIGLNIETRPDYGKYKHGNLMLAFGATRVEIGVQTIKDHVLKFVKRGHTINDTLESIATLRDLGFKITLHYMPGLPDPYSDNGRVSYADDLKGLITMVRDENYMADMLKIYPTLVVRGTPLYHMWKSNQYMPLTTDEAKRLLVDFLPHVPEWVRIMRIQRDIPSNIISAGVKASNLRQIVEKELEKQEQLGKISVREIRHREIARVIQRLKQKDLIDDKEIQELLSNEDYFELKQYRYIANSGQEIFLSIEHSKLDSIVGFLRLRILPRALRKEFTARSAVIRELHVYGDVATISKPGVLQHRGFGKRLVQEAEKIAKEEFDVNKMLVISGVGVREYYYKLGYNKCGVYVSKWLS